MATNTLAFLPSAFDSVNSVYKSENTLFSNVIGKDHTNETYAEWDLVTGSAAITQVYYRFDCSSIPADATIDSIQIQAKLYSSNAQMFYAGNTSLYFVNGTEQIGNGTGNQAWGTTIKTVELNPGTCTRDQLNDAGIKILCARGYLGTSRSYQIRFYGATLTIAYTTAGKEQFMLKNAGVWQPVSEVYKKINGVWVLQNNPAEVFDTETSYVKG